MKLSQLKKLIKEELEVVLTNEEAGEIFGEDVQAQLEADEAGVDEGKHKGEGTMARSQLARTGEIAHMLEKMIGDDTNLPEWVESKVTKAQDYLSSVLNYMRGEDLVDAGDAAREMKATAAVVNRGPLEEGGFFQDATAEESAEAAELAAQQPGEEGGDVYKIATESQGEREAEMIARLEDAIENARDLVASLPKDQREEAAEVLNRLETRYDHIMSGRVKQEADDPEEERPKRVTPQSIAALKRRVGRGRGVGMGSPKGAHRGKKPSQFDR
jgi:hypothetical protein